MSILTDQIYGGVAATDASTEPMRAERKPFGNLPSKEGTESPLFSGFTYAKDTEAATAFENGAEAEKNSPTDIRQLADEVAFFNTTTYGTAGSFAKLNKATNTVLTNLARFVNNGDGSETATTWNNSEMKTSFVQDGSGTRNQLARSEYTNDSGWKNELLGNGFDAGHKYEVKNVYIDQVTLDGVPVAPASPDFGVFTRPDTGEEIRLADLNQDGIINLDDFYLYADQQGEGS